MKNIDPPLKVALGGPPKSGKSCLREALKQAIRRIDGAPYPYVITACPDGEGAWFQETANRSSTEARTLKERYKALLDGFSPEFVDRVSKAVANCTLPLTLIDIGGIPSEENEQICADANAIILLAGDWDGKPWSERLNEWREFATRANLEVIAEVYSDYHGAEDKVEGVDPDGIFRTSIHYLERGEDLSERKGVKALAEHLIDLITAGQ